MVVRYSIRLCPPNNWCYSFTLHRLGHDHQCTLASALHVPKPSMLDDWADYKRLKMDRHDDNLVGDVREAWSASSKDGELNAQSVRASLSGDSGYGSVS